MKNLKFILLLFIASILPSCDARIQTGKTPVKTLSPSEAVRVLAQENKQYENAPPRGTEAHPQEIRAILDRGYIIFAMTAQDQKPFFYTDEKTGEFLGLDVEIGYTIANILGVKAVFNRDAPSFDGVVTKILNKEADVALSLLSITSRRAQMIRYTTPYIILQQALLVNRLEFAKIGPEGHLANYVTNFRGDLGIQDGSSYVGWAGENFPNANITAFEHWDDAVDALFDGKVLAIFHDECTIHIVSNTRQNAAILMKPVIISDELDPIAMAVSRDAPMLQNWLNYFIEDYKFQHKDELVASRLIERHFGGGSLQ